LLGTVPAVFILPEDIELTAGPASFHRQFLDLYISQFNKSYLSNLVSYRKVLLQRNRLLKEIAEKPSQESQLDAWDKLLIEHGARIIAEREAFINSIRGMALAYYREFDDKGQLVISYMPRVERGSNIDVIDAITNHLREYRPREIRAGLTLVGPHRDRLKMDIDGKSVRHYASRGQKRCVMLALKLAVAQYMTSITDKDVVLILDEVFAELDSFKSRSLMNTLSRYKQVFIATAGEFSYLGSKVKRFLVDDGVITEAKS
jgi:DNA replication and repair protein RecF